MSNKNNRKAASAADERHGASVQNVFGHPVRNMIVAAVVSILLGIAFILKPVDVSNYCGYGIGGLLALVGIVYIVLYFCHKPVSGEYRSEFVIGLVALLAGAYVALSGVLIGGSGVGYVLGIRIIGIFILCDALLKLQYSVDIARMGFRPWWIVLILALIGVGLGAVVVTDFAKYKTNNSSTPVSYLYNLGVNMRLVSNKGNYNNFYSGMMMLGIGFCFNGLLDLIAMALIAVRNHNARRDEAIAAGTAMVAAAQREELEERIPAASAEPVFSAEPEPATVYVPVPDPAPAPAPAFEPAPAPAPEPAAAPPAPEAAPEQKVYAEPPQAIPADPME